MGVGRLTYEEFRRQRLEENKKRMEEFNLTQLSRTLKTASPKPSPVKPGKPRVIHKELVQVRRSSRVANKPAPDYSEGRIPLYVVRPRKRSYNQRLLLDRVYASYEARSHAIQRANEVQSNLEPNFPSFVKPMTQSHVTGGFWLGLPLWFCKSNLPKKDTTISLVDENEEEEWETLFLGQKTGLSAGWRGFSIDHKLVDGDALVFHLIKPTTFKVYIIRASGYDHANG